MWRASAPLPMTAPQRLDLSDVLVQAHGAQPLLAPGLSRLVAVPEPAQGISAEQVAGPALVDHTVDELRLADCAIDARSPARRAAEQAQAPFRVAVLAAVDGVERVLE